MACHFIQPFAWQVPNTNTISYAKKKLNSLSNLYTCMTAAVLILSLKVLLLTTWVKSVI